MKHDTTNEKPMSAQEFFDSYGSAVSDKVPSAIVEFAADYALYLRKCAEEYEAKSLSIKISPLSFIGMESRDARPAQFGVTLSPSDSTPLIDAAVSNKPIKINGRMFLVSSFSILSSIGRYMFIVSPVICANRSEDEDDE